MRSLRAIPDDPADMLVALRAALAGDGPALLPYDRHGRAPVAPPDEVATRVSLVIETSGSAGTPKRVALSADALLASAALTQGLIGEPTRWILALPAHYVAGAQVLVRSIATQTEPFLLDPGFAPDELVAVVDAAGRDALALSVVPAQLARLVEAGESDPGLAARAARIAGILVGGQRTPPRLRERAEALGWRVITTYGSSETAGGCVYDRVPLPGVRLRLDDGELLLSSPTLAEGYLDDPDRTGRAFFTDGEGRWYRTGDQARIEDDGRLTVLGRLDDVIISGGEKVSLALVEREVRSVEGFEDAVVVATDSEKWGQVPVVVSARAENPARVEELREAVRSVLGRAAAPDRIVRADIPLLASGKPDRRELTALVARPVVHVSAVLLRRPDGRALLVRKRDTEVFMQPGGKPDPGESPRDAAIREVHEEVGVELGPDSLRPLGQHRAPAANEAGHDVVADAFEAVIDGSDANPAAEIAEAVWVDASEARSLPLAPLTERVFLPLIG